MDIYNVKKDLDVKYQNYTKNDLLWVLALLSSKKAEMRGPVTDYFSTMNSKLPHIQQVIKDGEPRGFRRLTTEDYKEGRLLLLGEIDGIPVIEKKFVLLDKSIEFRFKTSIYEALIYKHFFSYLLNNNITPNVPYYYGMRYEVSDDEAISLYSEYFEDGSSLVNYLNTKGTEKLPVEFWRPLLFQLIWTLSAFQNLGLVHNDLHVQNIYLLTGLTGKIAYELDGKKYIVNLGNAPLVKIYDMDMSSTKCKDTTDSLHSAFLADYISYIDTKEVEECVNRDTKHFRHMGFKQGGKSQFDLFVALCTILYKNEASRYFRNLLDKTTKRFIISIFEPELFADAVNSSVYGEHGHHCRMKKVADEGKSVAELLKDDYFKPLIGEDTGLPTFRLV